MKTVVTMFLEQAAKHPKNAAVLDIRGTYTYERMNNRSAYLAEQIMEQLGGKDRRDGLPCSCRGQKNLWWRCLPSFGPGVQRCRSTANTRRSE